MPVDVAQLKKAKAELEKVIKQESCGPILIRLAWHDAGTYEDDVGSSKWPNCGGANGSIRFDPELRHAANGGLSVALALLESMSEKYPKVSYADMFQLASATSVEVMGGPKIPMRYGRKDATGPDMCHPEGNLPAGEGPFPTGGDAAGHLRAVFHRMGFTDKDIVALSGAHTVGRVHSSRSGLNQKPETKYTKASACPVGTKNVGGQSWTAEWVKFDNSYYKNILDPKDDDLLVMASDACLVTDEKFKPFVEKYAADQAAFFKDYAEAHARLSELGVQWEGEPTPLP